MKQWVDADPLLQILPYSLFQYFEFWHDASNTWGLVSYKNKTSGLDKLKLCLYRHGANCCVKSLTKKFVFGFYNIRFWKQESHECKCVKKTNSHLTDIDRQVRIRRDKSDLLWARLHKFQVVSLHFIIILWLFSWTMWPMEEPYWNDLCLCSFSRIYNDFTIRVHLFMVAIFISLRSFASGFSFSPTLWS